MTASQSLVNCRVHRLRWGVRTALLIIEVETSTGIVGLGEASMSGDDARAAWHISDLFERMLRDRCTDDAPVLVHALARHAADTVCFVEATAASALEQALWDIRGQVRGMPIHELLGGARTHVIPLYANINRVLGARTPALFAEQAEAARLAGFRAVKCAPFDEVSPPAIDDSFEVLDPGLARIRAVRSAIGPDIDLMVDCHGRLGQRRAVAILPQLVLESVKWLEEPVITNEQMWRVIRRMSPTVGNGWGTDREALLPIAEQGKIVLAAGEFEVGILAFVELLALGVIGIVMPDVKHCGGIWTAANIAALTAAHGVRLSPHNPSGPVATLASGHVAAVSPTLDSLEVAWGELVPDQGLLSPALGIERGELAVSDEPGLGAHLIADRVADLRIPLDATNW